MHEMSLLRTVLDVVLAECEGENVTAVRTVHLTVGEASDIVEEYVEGLFQHLAKGTIAEGANVTITRTPLILSCNKCNEIFQIDFHNQKTWKCPRCESDHDFKLMSGREFHIDRIEIENVSPTDPEIVGRKVS